MNLTPDIDDFLDAPLDSEPTEQELIELVQLEEGEIDPRLKLLSHSSRNLLHTCPRKYQLYRLNSKQLSMQDESAVTSGVTFAYGHCVGTGIQSVLEDKSEDQIYLDAFLAWDTDLLAEHTKHNKSIWTALFSVERFILERNTGVLKDYELVWYNGKPAVEMSFILYLPEGFRYRGYIDAVLQHKENGHVLCLEDKTTGNQVNAATYMNSGQALGYSVFLDKIFPDKSAYEVLYLVNSSRELNFTPLVFEKTLLKRALWLQELILECEKIKLYEEYNCYPMHGENCYSFFRECEYLTLCTLSTESLTKQLTTKDLAKLAEDDEKYDFHIDFYDLVNSQMEKSGYEEDL